MTKSLRGLIAPENVLLDIPVSCKRSLIEYMSVLGAQRFGLQSGELFERLVGRERLGSTGVGGGIAIPHARADVTELAGMMLRLEKPVDFEAIDGEPVDLVFLLLAPEADNANHLKALSRIARTMRIEGVVRSLRGAVTPDAAYAALLSETSAQAA